MPQYAAKPEHALDISRSLLDLVAFAATFIRVGINF